MIRKILTGLAAGVMVFAFTQSYAVDNFWAKFDGKTAPSSLPMTVTPSDYNIFSLNQEAMLRFLNGLNTDYDKGQQIMLPTPDRKYRSFHVWKTPMMEPELAAKYPDIQTFTAVADDDQGVTAKLDYTMYGFRAIVFDGKKSFLIDPYSDAADGYYIAFYKSDFLTPSSKGACEVNSLGNVNPSDNGAATSLNTEGKTAARSNGSLRHVYRLALSCTGEYAQNAVGPNATKAQTLSKLVSTMNRVNGFYEKELSVTMNLIANNESIVYVSPGADPYQCNANLACLINEVQGNITSVIGPANYDIGHIVCTAGGGLAQLNSVCGGGKASGTSTSGGPDDFSTILHEMGHQFGSNHTFSANSGGCNGNGNENTGYEPGAGISVMSYAGLCDPNNVGNGEDYFHVSSLNEISTFLVGQGSSCGAINAGTATVSIPDLVDSFDIPQNTPFELTAPNATASQSQAKITYAWEQYDLGNFGEAESGYANAADGPIVRSFLPDTSKIRTYPSYDRIINSTYGEGAAGVGQRLPKVERMVRFKLTARSVYQGWGTFKFIDSVVRLKVATSGPFRVNSQSAGEVWNPFEKKLVEWSVAGTNTAPVNCGFVNIYLSLDDGATFPFLLVANAPNTGSYLVEMKDVFTTTGRIKVKGTGNVFFDINKGAITINGNPNGVKDLQLAEDLVVYPNPATDRVQIMSKNKYNTLSAVMYNVVGQRVWQGEFKGNLDIATGSFARGNYMIQVIESNSGAKSSHKVVLQ